MSEPPPASTRRDEPSSAPSTSLRRLFFALLAAAAAAALLASLLLWRHGRLEKAAAAEVYAYAPSARGLPKLWAAPPFSYLDQHEHPVTLAALRGRPWVADFIYTQCTSACPMMTSRMVMAQRALSGLDVRFVSFSVDPGHDTPGVLADYARRWNQAETRWSLLSTDAKHLQDTLTGFRVTAQRNDDPAAPIIHSNVFLLVDSEGWVRGVYDSSDDGARARLLADVRHIAAPAAPAPPAASAASAGDVNGGSLYASLGCAGCHDDARVAPPLDGVSGTQVTLQDGTKVLADDAYLRQSILDPAARIVAGYPATMPSYAGALSDAQLSTLVQQLDHRHGGVDAPQAAAPATVVRDPVCHMAIRASAETLHTTYGGRELYFCSQRCRDAFLADPGKFAGGGSNAGSQYGR